METQLLNAGSLAQVKAYQQDNHLIRYENTIIAEILAAINNNDTDLLNWFNQFGSSIRHILMNVHAYRKHLEFGFTEISLDKSGWFTRAAFLSREDLIFGNADRYGEHSIVYLGCGLNGIWTFAVDHNFGTAGGGYHLSVYGHQFKTREEAMNAGINELKTTMTEKVGHKDTTNYKPEIVNATLKAIAKFQISLVQLTLF